jgi:phosphohistidine phosphatase
MTRAKSAPDEPGPRCSLYLVRHAIAATRGEKWPDDTKRPLTHKGMASMRLVVNGLDALGVKPALVLTSPLVRAYQTAELLVEGLDSVPDLEVLDALSPGRPPSDVAEALGAYPKLRAIALVGHEPDMGQLAAWLIGAREPLTFKKGGACRIDIASIPPGRTGRLVWFATPKMLRALG